jgi:hypothetical protein
LWPTRARVEFRHLATLAGLLLSHRRHLRLCPVLDNIDIPTVRPRQSSSRPALVSAAARCPLLSIAVWGKRALSMYISLILELLFMGQYPIVRQQMLVNTMFGLRRNSRT